VAIPRSRAGRPGQRDAGKLADHDVHRPLRKRSDPRVSPLLRVARAAGPWWPMHESVVLTERPTEIHRGEELDPS